MKNKSAIRNYHLKDAELIIKAKQKIAFMQRDAAVFETFGITAADIAALAADISAFDNLETDVEITGNQTMLTNAKKGKAAELTDAIRSMMVMAALRFKKNTPHYKSFGTTGIERQKETDLYITAKLAVRLGNLYLPELAAYGLTTAHLNSISVLNEEHQALLIEAEIAKADRLIFREKRIALGNAIYEKLLRYTTSGISYWETRSRAHCNDYFLYSRPGRF